MKIDRQSWVRYTATAIGVAIGALILYIATIAPELPPGHDSAELIAAAASGGIAHPPGYPLYTMLGHLMVSLNPADPVGMMNMFSALSGALAVGFSALAFCLLSGSALAGGGAAALLALATTPWRLSVGAEVFALHLAFVAALLFLAAWWRCSEGRTRKILVCLGAFVFGLACAHHQTVVLLLPPLALFFWREHCDNPERSLELSWKVIPLFLLGLVPYAYLPWKSSQHPVINWGDPSNLERFFWVVLRQGYGGVQLSTVSNSSNASLYHLTHWGMSLSWWQFPILGFLIGLYGLVSSWNKKRSVCLLCAGLCLICGPIWALIGSQPAGVGFADMLERFYATSYLGFAGLIALGLAELSERSGANKPWSAIAVTVIALSLGFGLNWGRSSARGLYVISDAIQAMENSMPAGSLVVSCNDLTSGAFMYATAVQKRDMIHIPAGLSHSPWFRSQLEAEQAAALEKDGLEGLLIYERQRGRAVFSESPFPGARGFFVPYGLMYKYLAPGEPIPDRLQASIESLMYLEGCQRRDAGRDYSAQPFWAGFYTQRWCEGYRVLIKGLPQGSKMQNIAIEKAGGLQL